MSRKETPTVTFLGEGTVRMEKIEVLLLQIELTFFQYSQSREMTSHKMPAHPPPGRNISES